MTAPEVLAASQAIADVLTGSPRPADVVHRSGPAAYLRLDDGRIVALETGSGAALPISATVADLAGIGVGATVHLGGRAPRRWWSSDVTPVQPQPIASHHLAARLDLLDPPGDPHERALVGRSALDDPSALVGLGPGLTPAGDDLVAGALVALRAIGRQAEAGRIGESIDVARTTPISAALLVEAGHGRAARSLLGLVRALDGRHDLDRALDGLLAVGATSGRWLAEGVRQATEQL